MRRDIEPARTMHAAGAWDGETYYARPQLKAAPFEPNVVGGYIFLAGLSGASAILGTIHHSVEARRPRRFRHGRTPATPAMTRRSRYLSLLAPTIGSALLVYDLHTPQRFYNMMRVAKKTSPMSIGTWILLSFSAFAGVAGLAQFVADLKPRWRSPHRAAAIAQVPAAVTGAGLCTYTAALISATSTPLWAAAPRELAVRFGASSMATAAGALAIGEARPATRRALGDVLLAALTAELGADLATRARYKQVGIAEEGHAGRWATVEKLGGTGLGVIAPLALMAVSRLSERKPGRLATLAGLAAVAGSAAFRIGILGAGADSARRPRVSMRFAQPDNLPKVP